MSGTRRAALIAALVVVAVVAFIALRPSSSSTKQSSVPASVGTPTSGSGATPPAKPAIAVVAVKNAKAGGIKVLNFKKGDTVQFKVVSDVADEVHVHGYDVHKNVAPGHPVVFRFPGKIDGAFVIELESRGEQIASLQVSP